MTISKPKIYRRIGVWFCTAKEIQEDGKSIDLCFAAHHPRQAWREYNRYVQFYAGQR